MNKLPSGTVTFLFTDIEDSTPLWQEYPEIMAQAHALHDQILHEAIAAYNGYVFQIVGDTFSVAFHNAHGFDRDSLERLDRERDNLRAALEWALDNKKYQK